jgi:hypothetical protein
MKAFECPGVRPALALGARLASVLIVYAVLERWALGLGSLDAEAYAGTSILIGVARRLLVPPDTLSIGFLARLGVTVALFVAAWIKRRYWLAGWDGVDQAALLRVLVGLAAAVLAWAYSTYAYNYYFDQSHGVDRLALVLLAVSLLWRPIFVFPFAVLTVAIVTQFYFPIGGYSVAEQYMLVRVVLLFGAFQLVRSVWPSIRAADVVYLIVTLVVAGYVAGGMGKLGLGWFGHGGVGLMLPGAYGNGWLHFLDPSTIATITSTALRLDVFLVGFTFVVEVLAVFALVRRGTLLLYLPIWVGFHLGVVALSGIFFWKWILFEVTLFALLLRRRESPAFQIFSPAHALLSVPLILGGTFWFQPVNLSWYSVPVSYAYRIEAVDGAGNAAAIQPGGLAPYEYQFALAGFGYLSPYQQLPGNFGATSSAEQARRVVAASTPAELRALEVEIGRVPENPVVAAAFDQLMRAFMAVRSERETSRLRRWLGAPPQHLRFAHSETFEAPGEWVELVVRQVPNFFDGRNYLELAPRIVRRIDLTSPPDGGA